MVLPLGQSPQAVLDNDDGAVDDEAEVERAKAHQVARHAEFVHADRCHQHRERNDEPGDQGSAEVAEHHKQNDDDEESAFSKVLLDRRDSCIHQHRAIVGDVRLDARRQGLRDFRQPRPDIRRNRPAVGACQHEGGADHDFFAVLGSGSRAQVAADFDFREVLNRDRHAFTVSHHRAANLIEGSNTRIRADQKGLASPLQEVRSDRQVSAL